MTTSQVFLYFCLSFIGGIFLNSLVLISRPILLAFLILAVLLTSLFFKYKKLAVVGFCILFLVLGVWRHETVELGIMNSELRLSNDLEEKIVLIGVVAAEPDIREKSIKLTVSSEQLIMAENPEGLPPFDQKEGAYGAGPEGVASRPYGAGPEGVASRPYAAGSSRPISGRVLVTTNRYPQYQYGDKLKIVGFLKTPSEFVGFNYKNYLAKDGIYSVMDWPKVGLVDSGFGNPLTKTLFSFKNKFKETARGLISPPQNGVLEALIFGDEEEIPADWKQKLNLTGTRHITAVSGMNITIIGSLILSFALGLGLWRGQAFYLSVFLLVLYILMLGAPASAVRAGIMAAILLTAQHFGRLSEAWRAIVFAAALMLVQNPLLLRLDVGFQLSFLATLGIIFLQPIFSSKFKKIPNAEIFPLRTTLSTTIAAQIFTLPILVYNFGYIPLVSLPANILIVPFLAPITILLFVFGFAGMIFSPLGWLLSLPTWLSLTYIVTIIDWFSKIPFARLALQNIHWAWVAVSYFILAYLTLKLKEKERLKFLEY